MSRETQRDLGGSPSSSVSDSNTSGFSRAGSRLGRFRHHWRRKMGEEQAELSMSARVRSKNHEKPKS
ncbi:hypothetical protein PISMIDRAFT_17699 [Pisolithus microcarpus 441]|uniref:Uncharacterized protein n=1 Tax=Pisolithus microcarpus 441 TaxID=765257 RepID=A0A0C9Z1M1_9AGAM|nr:hypothetical protein PISMIDRAFT_17699 [Pisolithus microcarpus 441]